MNKGILSPLLRGRKKLQAYYNGVEEGENLLSLPQGGLRKRRGTEFLHESNFFLRLETFIFSTADQYVLAFSPNRMSIFRNGVLQENINGSGNDFLDTTVLGLGYFSMDFIQSVDTIIVTNETFYPQAIRRTSHTEWSIDLVPFTAIPQHDFNDPDSPTPVTQVQEVYFTETALTGDRFKISLEGILTDEIVYSNAGLLGDDAGLATAQAIESALQNHPLTASTGVSVTHYLIDSYRISFSGSSASDWELLGITFVFQGNPPYQALVAIEAEGKTRKEDAWSLLRGYPRKCTFHEARFWIGGSFSQPSTVWGSGVNDFFNFDKGRQLDDQSIEVTLDTDQSNPINAIFSNRALQVFTSGGSFTVHRLLLLQAKFLFLPRQISDRRQ
jgi:hypothetical protein